MVPKRKLFTISVLALLLVSMFAGLGVWQIKPAHATTFFSDDFEDNTFDAWTGVDSNCSIVTSPALCGTYSMFINATTSGNHVLVKTFSSTYSELYAQMLVRVDSLGGGTIYLKQLTLNTSLTYGANILIIQDYQGQMTFYRNNLKLHEIGDCPTVTSGTFSLTNGTTEQTIIELTPTVVTYVYNFWLDLAALTQNCTIRVYSKIDGTNYREIEPMQLTNIDYSLGLVLKEQMISTAWKITIQSTVVEGASRNIPNRYFTEVWG